MSRFKLSPLQFYQLTPREYFFALLDYEEVTIQKSQVLTRTMWEVMRYLVMVILNKLRGKGEHAIEDPKKVIRFEWDKESEPQSIEQQKQALLNMAKAFNATDKRKKPDGN